MFVIMTRVLNPLTD